MTRLRAADIAAGYENKKIIENMSVTIPEGKITSLIGPNGSGKSTLLKSFTRILPVKSAKIIVNNSDISTYSSKELAKKITLLAQTSEHPTGMTVEEVVSYGRYPYQKLFSGMDTQDHEAIEWALDATGLAGFRMRDIATLSGGQTQRVWIAMALAQETDILILDEPTTFLDPAHQLEILQLLTEINQMKQTTILMSIHDINHASRFSDYLLAMKNGKLITEGTPEEVITKECMKKIFEIDATIVTLPRTNKPVFLTYDLLPKEQEDQL
ncbi:TPA: ABC transporter ATP-binding protein [Enterococcus faecium]